MSVTRIIDGSHWVNIPSKSWLRRQHVDIVQWKCTQGTGYVDPSYRKAHGVARAAGLPWVAYSYAEPGDGSAHAQVGHLLHHANLRPGEGAMLDLETSRLSQRGTAAFQHAFGDELARRMGSKQWAYLGGYASNGSGRGAADHFRIFMYPRYASMATTGWRDWPPFGYPTPAKGGTTGFAEPHVWQFTPALAGFGDASISPHSVGFLMGEGDDDVQLNDHVKLNDWILEHWPDAKGLQDGEIQVETALGSGYGYARRASDNTEAILAQLQAQQVTIGKLVEALHADRPDLDKLRADIEAAINSITVSIHAGGE